MENAITPPRVILAPVDFSTTGFKAWGMAVELGRAFGASVEAVHAHEPPMYEVQGVEDEHLLLEDRARVEADLRFRLGSGHHITIADGFAPDAILETAAARHADLIVMGTHGRGAAGRVVFGSVAESVTRRSRVPVMTVRLYWRKMRSVLAALDFSVLSLRALRTAAVLAERLGAGLDAVQVLEPGRRPRMAEFEAAVAALGPYFDEHPPRLLLGRGKPAHAIAQIGARYDLIVVGAHGRSTISERLRGTTTEQVLRRSTVPVLAVPAAVSEPAAAA